jgi:1-deoxyxylulose-5-phosphate synthase
VKDSTFEPLGRSISRLVLGTAGYTDAPLDAPLDLLDSWRALGGNAIDTGRRYGSAEHIVGRWLRARGCRDEIVLSTKGAHYDLETGRSRVRPELITADLRGSLSALGVDSVDLYWRHRDDPAQPVGPILETLNEHKREGLIHAFGASNWSEERLDEAKAWCDSRGLESFSCSSPQLSLAVPAVEPWPGCVTIHRPASLEWYAQTQLPVFAWSSQAAGFFAGRTNEHIEQVYDTEENRQRRLRANELASRRGCTGTQIALAWVLHQDFPTYAVIGPGDVDELHESVAALDIELSSEELRWLDLGQEP